MVHLNKHAQIREDPFTNKTGGGNNEADSSGKNDGLQAQVARWGELELLERKQVVLSFTM
jgi:hypothetical protein